MAHAISNIDRQQGIEMAWHKLTEVNPDLTLAGSWLAQWDVTKAPLFTLGTDGKPIATEYCQLVATDDAAIHIGAPVHCETYQPVSNADFLQTIADALLGITGAKVASVGSVCGRGRVFVSVKLAELECFKAAGREFKPYLNFLNSHDQSSVFAVNTSTVCTVCNNTFGFNLHAPESDTPIRIRAKHTKNVKLAIANVPEIVEGFLGASAEFRAIMENLSREEVAPATVRPFFAGFLNPTLRADMPKTALEMSSRKVNQVERLTDLFRTGAGNRGRDLSDVFSAVTDYYSHESSGGDDMARQFVSSEFGAGQGAKARALEVLTDAKAFRATVDLGSAVLAAN